MEIKNQLKIRKIYTTQELRAVAVAWDNLWQRSEVCCPIAKAHLLALWVESIAHQDDFEAIIIEQSNEKFLAALPLISRSFKGIFKMGCLATSHEVIGGDFLLDPSCDPQGVVDLLVSALADSSFFFLSFESIAFNEERWQKLLAAMSHAKLLTNVSTQYLIGQVQTGNDWSSYEQSLSKNHRRNRRKQAKQLAQEGETQFVIRSDIQPSEVKSLLLRGFEVEHQSWKGKKGTSVIKTPEVFEYLYKISVYLAEQGQLELSFLIYKGKPIAFNYGWYSKGIHFIIKVGYNESFARFGPGQLLMLRFLQYLYTLPEYQLLDFSGPLVPWTQSWSTHTYPVGRIFSTTNRFSSRLIFQLYLIIKSIQNKK